MSGSTKLGVVAGLFAVLIALIGLSIWTHSVAPLFPAWVPPLVVAWVLARPGPAEGEVHGEPLVESGDGSAG